MVEALRALLDADPELVNAHGGQNEGPLHAACRAFALEAAWLLLERGAHINSRSNYGETPLMRACQAGYEEMGVDAARSWRLPRQPDGRR